MKYRLTGIGAIALCFTCHAVNTTWINDWDTTGILQDDANWRPASAPTDIDNVWFTNGTFTVGAAGDFVNNQITVQDSDTTWDLGDYTYSTLTNLLLRGSRTDGMGGFRLLGGTVDVNGQLLIGGLHVEANSLSSISNALLRTHGTSQVGRSGNNTLIIGAGAEWDSWDQISIGESDNQTNNLLIVSGPGALINMTTNINTRFYVGNAAGKNKMIVEDGASVIMDSLGGGTPSYIFGLGNGANSHENELIIRGSDTYVQLSNLRIGSAARSRSNCVTVTDGALLAVTNNLQISAHALCYANELVIENGATFTHTNRAGMNMNSGSGACKVIVRGDNSQAYVWGFTIQGNSNELIVCDGAYMFATNNLQLGALGGNTENHLTLSGSSTLELTETFNIGPYGFGNRVEVLDGSTLRASSYVDVGSFNTATGSVLWVAGEGTVATGMYLRVGGDGTLCKTVVSNNAVMYARQLNIGSKIGVSNLLDVVDGGTFTVTSDTFTFGNTSSNNMLRISNGRVSMPSTTGNGVEVRNAGLVTITGTNSLFTPRRISFQQSSTLEFSPDEKDILQTPIQVNGPCTFDDTTTLKISEAEKYMRAGGGTLMLLTNLTQNISGKIMNFDLPPGMTPEDNIIQGDRYIAVKFPDHSITILRLY